MTTFLNPFGSDTVPPSYEAYQAYSLSEDGQLYWPFQFDGSVGLLAANILDLSATTGGLSLILPPANQVSTGQDLLLFNTGANSIIIKDFDGNTLTVLDASSAKYLYLTDNSTTGGVWGIVSFGVGTGSADASVLAGFALQAFGSTLQVRFPYMNVNSNYTVLTADRGKLLDVTSGSATITLPQASVATDGYFIMVHNSSAGTATVEGFGTETVDGSLNKSLAPEESALFVCNGTNWRSIGYGRDVTFVFSEFVINMASGSVAVTSAQVAGKMIRLTGVAAGNLTITLPTVDNIYFINVEAGLGGFSATFTTGSGSTVIATANAKTILYCDGTNVSTAITTAIVSTLSLNDGSAGAPTVTFALDTDTGLYRPGSNTIGFTAGGSQVAAFDINGLKVIDGSKPNPSISFINDTDSGFYRFADNDIRFAVAGNDEVIITATGVNVPVLASANATITGGAISGVSLSASSVTITPGNLSFTSTGQRIRALFSGATPANRLMFQDSNSDQGTLVGACPSGTGTFASFTAYGSSDVNNSAYAEINATNLVCQFASYRSGSAAFLPMTFHVGGSEQVRINTNGNIGLWTAAAVANPAGIAHSMAFGDSDTGFGWISDGSMRLYANNEIKLAWAGGSDGITVYGSGEGGEVRLTDNVGTLKAYVDYTTVDGSFRLVTVGGGIALQFNQNSRATSQLNFDGSGDNSYAVTFRAPSYGDIGYIQGHHQPGLYTEMLIWVNQDSRGYSFRNSGIAYAPVAWQVSSDERLKKEIRPIDGALNKIGLISGCTFERINDDKGPDKGRRHAGFLAQEIHAVLPEATSNYDEETLAVDPMGIIALLVQSVKELKDRVEAFEGKTK